MVAVDGFVQELAKDSYDCLDTRVSSQIASPQRTDANVTNYLVIFRQSYCFIYCLPSAIVIISM